MSCPARAIALLAFTGACAGGPPQPAAAPPAGPVPDTCIVAGTPARVAETVTVVLDPPPDPGALPESGSDWFAAAHGVEPLIRIDCTGTPRGGLATRWERLEGGRAWVFFLREGAALPDGSPASAAAIAADWRRPAAAARLALAEVAAVAAPEAGLLRVTFAAPTDSAPARLADPVLAPGLQRAEPWDSSLRPYFRSRPAPGDLRDAVDAEPDFVVTSDAATLAYARSRAELAAVPLPWGRTYVFASPRPFAAARDERFRGSLAREVVPGDARPAAPPLWWDLGCAPAPAPAPQASASRGADSRIVYPAGDSTAAAIAGRLVALGAAGPRGSVQPVPVRELLSRLGRGEPLSAVLPVPRLDPAPCAVRSLALSGWFIAPLVDTRAHLIARRGGPAVEADWFGALRVAQLRVAPSDRSSR